MHFTTMIKRTINYNLQIINLINKYETCLNSMGKEWLLIILSYYIHTYTYLFLHAGMILERIYK
jgi:hypothetical protein